MDQQSLLKDQKGQALLTRLSCWNCLGFFDEVLNYNTRGSGGWICLGPLKHPYDSELCINASSSLFGEQSRLLGYGLPPNGAVIAALMVFMILGIPLAITYSVPYAMMSALMDPFGGWSRLWCPWEVDYGINCLVMEIHHLKNGEAHKPCDLWLRRQVIVTD
ncbi:hypothetical protein Nepgr_005074 [Nepenthes gracilis]|uniref:Uncharacterized protein n=1 Tax=Nepenthes gracilis TaxID=150966 RepID=A0AAD3S2H7_NEPGR|nr:hypothetical protein Nepgr_005074 [Nepenthes gracilis]